MTKAQQILALYDGKRSTREIADIVGCDTPYVRVVARQRKGRGASDIDRRHLARFAEANGITKDGLYKRKRRNSDAAYWERQKKYLRDYYRRKKAEREAANA